MGSQHESGPAKAHEYLVCVIDEHPGQFPPHGKALRDFHCPDDPDPQNPRYPRTVWQETTDMLG